MPLIYYRLGIEMESKFISIDVHYILEKIDNDIDREKYRHFLRASSTQTLDILDKIDLFCIIIMVEHFITYTVDKKSLYDKEVAPLACIFMSKFIE